MRAIIPILGLAILVTTFTACEREDEADEEETTMPAAQTLKPPAWTDALDAYLPALGHRNWIVVADSAFPLQISPGIETIVSNEDHFMVLGKVLKAVDAAKPVRPKVYLDKELAFVPEALAPGADDARRPLHLGLYGDRLWLLGPRGRSQDARKDEVNLALTATLSRASRARRWP